MSVSLINLGFEHVSLFSPAESYLGATGMPLIFPECKAIVSRSR